MTIDWLTDPRICMRPMHASPRGARAQVSAHVRFGDSLHFVTFIIDSGAAFSFAPLELAAKLLGRKAMDLEPHLKELGVKDVHGRRPRGLRLEVELELRLDAERGQKAQWDQRPRLQESIYFCEGISHALLGQSAFFERFGVVFLNFPTASEGRRFGLFAPPPAAPPVTGP